MQIHPQHCMILMDPNIKFKSGRDKSLILNKSTNSLLFGCMQLVMWFFFRNKSGCAHLVAFACSKALSAFLQLRQCGVGRPTAVGLAQNSSSTRCTLAALEHRKLSTAIAQRVGRGTSNKDLRWALYESKSKIWIGLGRLGRLCQTNYFVTFGVGITVNY